MLACVEQPKANWSKGYFGSCSEGGKERGVRGRAGHCLRRVARSAHDNPAVSFGDARPARGTGSAGGCSLLLPQRLGFWMGADPNVYYLSVRLLLLRGVRGGDRGRSRTRYGSYHGTRYAPRAATGRSHRPSRDRCLGRCDHRPDRGNGIAGDPWRVAADALVVVRSGDQQGAAKAGGGAEAQQRASTWSLRAGVSDRYLRLHPGGGDYPCGGVGGAAYHGLGHVG